MSVSLRPGPGSSRRTPSVVPPGAEVPEPEEIQRQKDSYARSLATQLKEGMELLSVAHKQQVDTLHAQANQEKQRYCLALDQAVKQQEFELSRRYNEQLMRLQQAAQSQRAELEQQANSLTHEYQQRKANAEFARRQAVIEEQHKESQGRLLTDFGQRHPSLLKHISAQQQMAAQPLPAPLLGAAALAPPALPPSLGGFQGSSACSLAAPSLSLPASTPPPALQAAPPMVTATYEMPPTTLPTQRSYVPPVAAAPTARQYAPPMPWLGGGSTSAPPALAKAPVQQPGQGPEAYASRYNAEPVAMGSRPQFSRAY